MNRSRIGKYSFSLGQAGAGIVLLIALPLAAGAQSPQDTVPLPAASETIVDGVTFADDPGRLYAPIRSLAEALDWPLHWQSETETISLDNRELPAEAVRRLPDGTRLVALPALK